jgi:hypothetical protein
MSENVLGNLVVVERKIFKIFYSETLWRCGLDSCGLGQGPVAGSCEHVNEHSAFVKGAGILHGF